MTSDLLKLNHIFEKQHLRNLSKTTCDFFEKSYLVNTERQLISRAVKLFVKEKLIKLCDSNFKEKHNSKVLNALGGSLFHK